VSERDGRQKTGEAEGYLYISFLFITQHAVVDAKELSLTHPYCPVEAVLPYPLSGRLSFWSYYVVNSVDGSSAATFNVRSSPFGVWNSASPSSCVAAKPGVPAILGIRRRWRDLCAHGTSSKWGLMAKRSRFLPRILLYCTPPSSRVLRGVQGFRGSAV